MTAFLGAGLLGNLLGASGLTRGILGRAAWNTGGIAAPGDTQAGEHILRGQSTSATPVRLTADGAAPNATNTVNLPNGATYVCRVLVVGRQVGGTAGTVGDSKGFECTATIVRGASAAATATLAQSSVGLGANANATGWTAVLSADTTNGGLALTCTGQADKTIRWAARVLSAEVVG